MLVRCENCSKEFKKTPYKVNKYPRNFCSRECFGFANRLDVSQYINKEYNGRVILSEAPRRNNSKTRVNVKCKCGFISDCPLSQIISNTGKVCSKCKGRKKYVGEISGGYFTSLKRGASVKDDLFEITQDNIWNKFLEQDRKCYYSGIELTWQDGFYGERGTASVDRTDSNIGYLINNFNIIHKDLQIIKSDHTEKYFLYICKLISEFDHTFTKLNYTPRKRHSCYRGCGELSGNYWSSLRCQARNENREFRITIEQAWGKYIDQGGVCALSGIPIVFELDTEHITDKTASLDRINSKLGYVENNCQWVHKDINYMKCDFEQNYFIELCRKVTDYQNSKKENKNENMFNVG